MIGSDWPVCTVAASYSQAVDIVKNYVSNFPVEVREAVLGGNAARFWKLAG
jgi:L-fuconolactonase